MARLIDVDALKDDLCKPCDRSETGYTIEQCRARGCGFMAMFDKQPTIDAHPVRHGHWIECDYQHLEHGEVETEPRAGWCCSVCHVGYSKEKMTYKQYCPHCGAKMDGGEDDG